MIAVMVDIETFGGSPKGSICQIGAVAFDPAEQSQAFEHVFSLNTSTEGLDGLGHYDENTVRWWLTQPDIARHALLSPPPVPLAHGLMGFHEFYKDVKAKEIWAHGANFDLVILNYWFNELCIERPWHWRDERCTRTLFRDVDHKAEFADLYDNPNLPKHIAVADAVRQAQMVQRITARRFH